jgi:hypothetical protein
MKSTWRIALRWVALTASIVCAAELAVENSDARTLDRLGDPWPALSECWQPPPGSAGMEVTVRFSLKRSGAIVGEPRITYSRLWGHRKSRTPSAIRGFQPFGNARPYTYPTGWGAQSQAGRFQSDSSPPPNRWKTMSIAGI